MLTASLAVASLVLLTLGVCAVRRAEVGDRFFPGGLFMIFGLLCGLVAFAQAPDSFRHWTGFGLLVLAAALAALAVYRARRAKQNYTCQLLLAILLAAGAVFFYFTS